MKRETRNSWSSGLALASLGWLITSCSGPVAIEDSVELAQSDNAVDSGALFGTYCQKEYQNSWQTTLSSAWDRCGWFNNELDDTDQKIFYFNLHGAKPFWEQNNDQDWIEQVDLLYTNTHGGAWSDTSTNVMWDDNTRAFTNQIRWGDEGIGLSIHAAYQCKTLKQSDNAFWTRMGSVFAGGMKIALGSHDLLFDGSTTDEVGEDFADNMQGSQTLKTAWRSALEDWNVDNDVTVAATGASAADCGNRRDNMKWQNFRNSFARIRDGQITHWCASNWDNL